MNTLKEAQARTDATVARVAQQQEHINKVVAVMAESQQHTDERLHALGLPPGERKLVHPQQL
ncbi:MAG TPA: hypothetical protein VGC91_17020 [Pyrinomonadaceae bacterium]|jgi:hypothetical protein